jgi:acetyl-CoA acetyltransferase
MPRVIREVAVAGVYQTKQGDLSDRVQADVWFECAKGACEDAGISLGDVDGLVSDGPQGAGIRSKLPAAALGYDLLGKPHRYHASSSIGAAMTSAGLNLAVHAVSTRLAEVVLIVNAVAGKPEGSGSVDRDKAVAAMAMNSGYEYVYGTTRVSDYAVLAKRHMHDFGTTSAQLTEIALAQRHGAALHPLSVNGHRGELTIDDVINSRMIADLYYQDPDGNNLELQIDSFPTTQELQDYFERDPDYAANPLGAEFDPDELVRKYEAGVPFAELIKVSAPTRSPFAVLQEMGLGEHDI